MGSDVEAAAERLADWVRFGGPKELTSWPEIAADIGLVLSKLHQDAGNGETRPCTCHPDDNPPTPCARKYAASECAADALERGSQVGDSPQAGDVTDCFRCGGSGRSFVPAGRCAHCAGAGKLRWISYGHSEPAAPAHGGGG